MADEEVSLREVSLRVVWVGVDEEPIHFANQLASQFQRDEFIVTFGQMAPPLLLGTRDEQLEQLSDLGFIPVRPVVRLGIPVDRMREFVKVLQENLDRYDAKQRGDEEET